MCGPACRAGDDDDADTDGVTHNYENMDFGAASAAIDDEVNGSGTCS
jgi:hypothetical protein